MRSVQYVQKHKCVLVCDSAGMDNEQTHIYMLGGHAHIHEAMSAKVPRCAADIITTFQFWT